jgi:two-component system NtrC family response regulator
VRAVDVRVVAAANRHLAADVEAGRFRLDLLYRLAVVRITIPPLRERPEDIRALAEHCWAEAAARMGTRARLTDAVIARLERHPWPGNVRELQNAMAALAVMAPGDGHVPVSALPSDIGALAQTPGPGLVDARTEVERHMILRALAASAGNGAMAARALGMTRQGLQKARRRLRLDTAPSAHT